MIVKCPVCRKSVDILHADQWAYNINKKQYFCSWKCLQKYRAQKEESKLGKITLDQKKRAVNIAVTGGDPIAFLKECGSDNPGVSWSNILRYLEKENPEAYDLITARKKAKADKGMPKKDDVPVVKVTGPIVIETPETNQVRIAETPEELDRMTRPITKPVNYDGFSITGVRAEYGEFHISCNGYLFFGANDHDELEMPVDVWKKFAAELPRVMAILGVEL